MTIESNNLILLVWIHAVMIRERKKHGNACLVFTVQNSRRLVSGRVRRRWFRIRCLYFAWLEHILAFSKVNIFFNNENKRSNWRLLIAFDCFFFVFALQWNEQIKMPTSGSAWKSCARFICFAILRRITNQTEMKQHFRDGPANRW